MTTAEIVEIESYAPHVVNRMFGSRMFHRCKEMPVGVSVDIEKGEPMGTLEVSPSAGDDQFSFMVGVNCCPYCGTHLADAFDYEIRKRAAR